MSSVDLLKAGDFDGIRHLVDGALKAGQDKNVGHEYVKDIEERYRENSRAVIANCKTSLSTFCNSIFKVSNLNM